MATQIRPIPRKDLAEGRPDGAEELIRGGAPPRGDDGKFQSTKGKGDDKGGGEGDDKKAAAPDAGGAQPPSKEAQPDAKADGGAAPPKKQHPRPQINPDGSINMLGKRFKSLEHLQQVFASKAGDAAKASRDMAGLNSQVQELQGRLVTAANLATSWMTHAKGLQTQIDGGAAPAQDQQGKPGAQAPAPEGAVEETQGFSLETYDILKEKHGPQVAAAYARKAQALEREAREKALTERFDKMLAERLGPLEQNNQRMATLTAAQQIVTRAAQATNADGSPRFPQLRDAAAREGILGHWAKLPDQVMYADDFSGFELAALRHEKETVTKAGSEDDLGLDDLDSAFTMEGDDGVPRPREGDASGHADFEESLIRGGGSGGDDDLSDIMPSI